MVDVRVLGIVLFAVSLGCGSRTAESPIGVAVGYRDLEKAESEFKKKNYQDAVKLLTVAIERGSLRADLLGELFAKRAFCHIKIGDDAKAAADLELAEQSGSAGGPTYLAVKGYLAQKSNRTEEARQLFEQARQADPGLDLPKIDPPKKDDKKDDKKKDQKKDQKK